ncbi:type I polyketide synthase, partial [Streptomyces sp. NPDC102360]|uniref:type I polyketide synthase n=1 Tax=Streptomyces sp. NPDC102360 TaxID=3366160 RepID=UPI003804BBF6
GTERFTTSLAEAWTRGVAVDWAGSFDDRPGQVVDLPTYPFQHTSYWLKPASSPRGEDAAATLGQDAARHPFLGAAVSLADGAGTVFTGRLSLRSHPWLADHAALGTVLLPGTGLVELVLRAGEQDGLDVLEELTLQAPLVLPADGAIQIQVTVGVSDEDGHATVSVHSRPEHSGPGTAWTLHATGFLAAGAGTSPGSADLSVWPPAGAEPVDLAGWYDSLAAAGYEYGPAFQGLTAAWRHGGDVYAEVALAPEQAEEAGRFALHPALLDATLHAIELGVLPPSDDTRLPFAWSGVRLYATGATAARVRLGRSGQDAVTLHLADATGAPVATVDSLARRPVSPEQLAAAGQDTAGQGSADDGLFRLDWVPAGAVEAFSGTWTVLDADGGPAALDSIPDAVLAPVVCDTDPATAAGSVLALLQEWLGEERYADSRLVVVTRGAVGEVADLSQAPVWGLVRSAQSENPDRFVLVDLVPGADVADAVAVLGLGEPQVAVRDGGVFVPRLVRATDTSDGAVAPWDREGTVVVTGAFGSLGRLVTRHLLVEHRVRSFLLLGRRGERTPGAAEWAAELAALGARVTVAACDVADAGEVRRVLGAVPAEFPVRGIVHTAGVLDDTVLTSLTPERLDAVMAPKAIGAHHLHQASEELGLDLTAFVLFSSVQGVLGGAGQANYAAANTFLDALAEQRRAQGLPATSLAWGLWAEGGMEAELDEADRERMIRTTGMTALSPKQGITLFDRAVSLGRALLVPARIDTTALRSRPADGVPAVLRGFVRKVVRRAAAPAAAGATGALPLADRLASLSTGEQDKALLELVRNEVAAVLGAAVKVEARRGFKQLGFDSLTAVELRNRLNKATGLRLPATLVFDHPTPVEVAALLRAGLVPDAGPESPADPLADGGTGTDPAEPAVETPDRAPGTDMDLNVDVDLIDDMDVDALVRLAQESL